MGRNTACMRILRLVRLCSHRTAAGSVPRRERVANGKLRHMIRDLFLYHEQRHQTAEKLHLKNIHLMI